VDITAMELASSRGFLTRTFLPDSSNWEGYKKRNIMIAKECDELYCITIPKREGEQKCYHHNPSANHMKTAGCWTMSEALRLNKKCKLLITP